jgi:hypothetical protein
MVAHSVIESDEATHGVSQHTDALIAEVGPQLIQIVRNPLVGVRGARRDL